MSNAINGKTSTGFEFCIPAERLDDYELVEQLIELEKGDMMVVVPIVKALMDDDEEKRLKEHVKAMNGGRCTFSGMAQEISEIFLGSSTGKN